ncbi:hypothetical protein L0152_02510 [bacterium]|nr:hypothetical protein [bacterium]
MFCPNCDQRIHPGLSYCTSCGLKLAYAYANPRASAAITVSKTIRLIRRFNSTIDDRSKRPLLVSLFAILYIAAGIPALLNGFLTIANTLYAINANTSVETIISVGFGFLFIALGSLLYLTGTGLWNLKPNSRIIHMVLSALSILTMIGAPIAVLVLWYFTRPEIRILFSGKS